MAINVAGLVSIIVFYLAILAVGIWAGWKNNRKNKKESGTENVMLAGRNMGVFVGIMTMTGKKIIVYYLKIHIKQSVLVFQQLLGWTVDI